MQTARDFMRCELITLSVDTHILDGVAKLLHENISGAPVVDAQRNYLGMFSEKCSLKALTEMVETAEEAGQKTVPVREFMTRELVTLSPETDVFDAIDQLLLQRVSGAPVVDADGNYLGIFSEKSAMHVLMAAVYDQVPGSNVRSYMDVDRNRLISPDDTLHAAAQMFQHTAYRRLPVLRGDKLVGQVSRRDVLKSEHQLVCSKNSQSRKADTDQNSTKAASTKLVGQYMDRHAMTKSSNSDMLSFAQTFLHSPYRRLPIVEEGKLIGQVSRRDLLQAAMGLLRKEMPGYAAKPLYLSSITDNIPPSLT